MNMNKPKVLVVFHLDETEKTMMVIKNMLNLLSDDSIIVRRLALVVNGGAINILAKQNEHETNILTLLKNHAEVYACLNAMKSSGITVDQLITGVRPVPSGVGQLALLQTEHFAYIRP